MQLTTFHLLTLFTLLHSTTTTSQNTPISNKTLQSLPRPNTDFNIHTGPLLSPLLHPRIPGTPGSSQTRTHLTNFFKSTLPTWTLEYQTSTSNPDKIPITNLIATRDPPGLPPGNISRLTLVSHYDTKESPTGFIGAIDSAAPCAILLHVVRSVDAALTRKWASPSSGSGSGRGEEGKGIQVVFTDGEEGFDSHPEEMLSGARSLAAEWGGVKGKYPGGSKFESRIRAISLFVLLDLLGSRGPKIVSYFNNTHGEYRAVAGLEGRLRGLGLFRSTKGLWFTDGERDEGGGGQRYPVYDDHVPFQERGVRVLHVIDNEPEGRGFPGVWHTLDDDGEHLDEEVLGDWSVLVIAFVVEWLGLEGYMA
ncbi:glutaminyl cyclase [Aspergillus alliaceus]|uniref:Peptide hydrolase n=1 Tax=Petromyces alliaceus TaxID=209559 RepID=A0A5N7CC85_PETAA|nr:glutaminyl cyclase [Aspergillus alliaceus]